MSKDYPLGKFLVHSTLILWLVFVMMSLRGQKLVWNNVNFSNGTAPLMMTGGDPHIRALMRTISASESNVPNPYSVLYGGEYTQDLSHHPDRCMSISVGPNSGRCSTAAGRYQFLSTTWTERARFYHPQPVRFMMWESYSFEPQFQDAVVYGWLDDPKAWGGADLRLLLQQGNVDEVLQHLSPTWTSLGYGIETNSMSTNLPGIYQKMLQEEMAVAQQGSGAIPVSQPPAKPVEPVMN
jgi:muramidase (phage lysozyme)